MKIPRDLSGVRLVETLCRRWDYVKVHQVGSHIILETRIPSHQRIAVPAHDPLRVGTLNAIVRSVAQHKNISRDDILTSL